MGLTADCKAKCLAIRARHHLISWKSHTQLQLWKPLIGVIPMNLCWRDATFCSKTCFLVPTIKISYKFWIIITLITPRTLCNCTILWKITSKSARINFILIIFKNFINAFSIMYYTYLFIIKVFVLVIPLIW